MRISIFLFSLFLVQTSLYSNKMESPNRHNFAANDPYDGVPYEERPEAVDRENILTVNDLLRQNVPTFWKHKTSMSDSMEINKIAEMRARLDLMEKKVISRIEEIPGVYEIIEENKMLEAEIQNFLTLRRAELKDLHKQIKKVQDDLSAEKQVKANDIDDVQVQIQRLYGEIDLHLEQPDSSYSDSYVANRKERVRKLMRKKKTLKKDYVQLDYPRIRRLKKRLEFLEERRNEIHEKSKDLSFKYVRRRVEQIEKNNARVNYLAAVHLPRSETRKIRTSLSKIREIRGKIESAQGDLKSKDSAQAQLESEIMFEERYYDEVANREQEILDEIRRSRETIRQGRSQSRADGSAPARSSYTGGSSVPVEEQKKAAGKKQHMIVVPLQQGMDLEKIGQLPGVLKKDEHFSSVDKPTIIYMTPDQMPGASSREVADSQEIEELKLELQTLRESMKALSQSLMSQGQQQRMVAPTRNYQSMEQMRYQDRMREPQGAPQAQTNPVQQSGSETQQDTPVSKAPAKKTQAPKSTNDSLADALASDLAEADDF